MKTILPLSVVAAFALVGPALICPAQARSLDTIRSTGVIGLCAHPNSLPFASKAGDPPGFQVELGQALARDLGVSLNLDWIITRYQMRSAGCDILLDVIADREAQSETNLRISKPYYRTGVALAVLAHPERDHDFAAAAGPATSSPGETRPPRARGTDTLLRRPIARRQTSR